MPLTPHTAPLSICSRRCAHTHSTGAIKIRLKFLVVVDVPREHLKILSRIEVILLVVVCVSVDFVMVVPIIRTFVQ